MRGIINDYIIEKAPASAESLNKQSLMFRARDSMAEKGAKQVKTNIIQRTAKEYPTLTKTAKNAAILVGAGLGGREVISALK